jgi:aminopeptidase N
MDQHQMFDFPFEIAFRSWEMQEGVPLVTARYDAATTSFRVTQERFFDDKTRGAGDQTKWYIPISYATASNGDFSNARFSHYFYLGIDELQITDNSHSNGDWFVFNKQQIGYYRVNYEESNWRALTEVLKSEHENIHILNRVQIIDDAFSLAKAGYIDYDIPYDIVMYLLHEFDFFAWDIAMVHFDELYSVFGPNHELLNVSCLLIIFRQSVYFL